MPDILMSENLIDHVLYFKRSIILRCVQPRNSRAGLNLVHGKANRNSINKWIIPYDTIQHIDILLTYSNR